MIDRIAAGRTDLVFDVAIDAAAARTKDDAGVALIEWCAYYGDVSAIRHLLSKGEFLTALGANFDLGGAAFHGHWRLCEFLVEAGADPNARNCATGETALHAAASKANSLAHEATIKCLLAAGADPNAKTLAGAVTGHFMRDARTYGETPLHRAAAFATEAAIDALIAHGGDKSAKDAAGDTPLSWASLHLRPSSILRKLCYADHRIHPDAAWTGDHGAGATGMDANLIGRPKE